LALNTHTPGRLCLDTFLFSTGTARRSRPSDRPVRFTRLVVPRPAIGHRGPATSPLPVGVGVRPDRDASPSSLSETSSARRNYSPLDRGSDITRASSAPAIVRIRRHSGRPRARSRRHGANTLSRAVSIDPRGRSPVPTDGACAGGGSSLRSTFRDSTPRDPRRCSRSAHSESVETGN